MKKLLIGLIVVIIFIVPLWLRPDSSKGTKSDEETACETNMNIDGEELPLEEYILGVIAAEMPASYHLEALKAQAIAARTYAFHKLKNGEGQLTATTKHQVFYTPTERKERWLASYDMYEQKLTQAVEETAGEIMTYGGEPISAMFHAASNGKTESAANYSGHDIPYLQSVSSPETDEKTQPVQNNTQWSTDVLLAAKVVVNDTGRVDYVLMNGERISGRDIREQLNLRSTDFSFYKEGGSVLVKTKGYGHGVGMSQKGANIFAEEGKTADEILLHYYRGVKIETISCKK